MVQVLARYNMLPLKEYYEGWTRCVAGECREGDDAVARSLVDILTSVEMLVSLQTRFFTLLRWNSAVSCFDLTDTLRSQAFSIVHRHIFSYHPYSTRHSSIESVGFARGLMDIAPSDVAAASRDYFRDLLPTSTQAPRAQGSL